VSEATRVTNPALVAVIDPDPGTKVELAVRLHAPSMVADVVAKPASSVVDLKLPLVMSIKPPELNVKELSVL
jgi:hypothetical protein